MPRYGIDTSVFVRLLTGDPAEDYTETVLIPITLDDYLFKQSKDNWTIGEINRRFVQDFSGWKDHDAFESAFKKVVDALRTDGGKPPPPASKLTPRK